MPWLVASAKSWKKKPICRRTERWPDYRSLPPPTDSDHDGLPDFWERQFSLDPRDAADCRNASLWAMRTWSTTSTAPIRRAAECRSCTWRPPFREPEPIGQASGAFARYGDVSLPLTVR